jgi:hypothetical protein
MGIATAMIAVQMRIDQHRQWLLMQSGRNQCVRLFSVSPIATVYNNGLF